MQKTLKPTQLCFCQAAVFTKRQNIMEDLFFWASSSKQGLLFQYLYWEMWLCAAWLAPRDQLTVLQSLFPYNLRLLGATAVPIARSNESQASDLWPCLFLKCLPGPCWYDCEWRWVLCSECCVTSWRIKESTNRHVQLFIASGLCWHLPGELAFIKRMIIPITVASFMFIQICSKWLGLQVDITPQTH